LKRLRVEAGLSQEQLAKRARISVQSIGAYERGTRRAPHRETFALIAKALDVSGERYDDLAAAAEIGRLRGVLERPSVPRHNLPLQLTPLIGRDEVVAQVRELVAEARLVTLVGTGGIGKTRTALEAVAGIQRFRDGVWFAELAALSDGALVAGTIALALGIAEQADRPALGTLQHRLREKSLLLVLDNCEHLIEETARVAEDILRTSPDVQILATSRERLRIRGEHVYRVPSLDVPPPGEVSAETAARYGSVALFAECAASSNPSFALTDRNVSAVAELCRRLDGIPLAIELAAARVTALAPEQLVSDLDARFRVLAGGSRTALPRQQTMRALIDWSHNLLNAKEQRLFRRLAIFAGGWSLAAASDVCADSSDMPPGALTRSEIVSVLESLVDKSLVVAPASGREVRYHLLESTRAYALEKLDRAGERPELSRRHAEFVASFAAASLAVSQYSQRVALLRADVENIRSAIAWCLAYAEALPIAARILRDARAFLSQNLRAELQERMREVLRREQNLDPELRADLFIQLSLVTVGSESLEAARRAISLLESGGLKTIPLMRAFQRMSYALAQLRRVPEALDANRRAIELYHELGVTDPQHLRTLHCGQGYLLNYQWQLEAAREAWTKARDLSTALDDTGRAAIAQGNMAETLFFEGDISGALRLTEECLEVFRREGLTYLEALTLDNLGAFRLQAGDCRTAAGELLAAVAAARKAGDDGLLVARAVRHTAMLSAMQGDYESAGELLGYTAAWFEARGFYDPGDERQFQNLEALLREHLNAVDFDRLMSAGAQLDEQAGWQKSERLLRAARS
jgi:predicted ATPase/DNA-binding XRE family transcriptional regulator